MILRFRVKSLIRIEKKVFPLLGWLRMAGDQLNQSLEERQLLADRSAA